MEGEKGGRQGGREKEEKRGRCVGVETLKGQRDGRKIIVKAFKFWSKSLYLLPFQGELTQT